MLVFLVGAFLPLLINESSKLILANCSEKKKSGLFKNRNKNKEKKEEEEEKRRKREEELLEEEEEKRKMVGKANCITLKVSYVHSKVSHEQVPK